MEGSWVEEKRLFHGSPHAQEIATDGFDRGYAKDSGMFGKGVYFAENSSKSNNYAYGNFSPCKDHTNRQCELCTLCKVALGKVFETTSTVKSCPRGYHSVKALPQRGFLNHVEYIIYNDDQVYPRFLIEYTTTYTAQVVPRPNPQIDPFFRQFLRLKRMMNKPQQNRQNTKGCIIL
ncbi:poly [ADP-ribose] polymerase tankyrase-like isoform X2 [Neocloeon triangulifer]|nr:poly [ADP-ribose] polymerase tankyrase-like isoform X2 [Neocloeon triangulifer]XP_059470242.1 poly [ADP-ribose] polymerase tankyrase-like isoform X2 [Neocloeon triangulifer]